MRSSSEDVKSHVQQWLTGGFERGKSCNDPQSATSVDNQDKTDDEYEEAREETEHYLPKEPMELEDMAEDHDGSDQQTDLNKTSNRKIQDTDLKLQRATAGSRHARDNDGRDGRTEDGQEPKISVTVNTIPTLGGKRREEHAPADGILVSVPGHTGDDRRDEHLRSGRIVDSGQGPMPPRESPCKSHRGGDRRDEQRQFDRIGSKPEKGNGPKTAKEIPEIGRGPASKHPSPPRNMPGRTAATPFVAPSPPYKGKKDEEQSPPSCCCIVL